ncbi:MAG: hypothetical protein ACRCUY_08745 [Thermoguttaceae bacterium]
MNADGVREHGTPRVSGTNPVGFRCGEKLNSKDVVEYKMARKRQKIMILSILWHDNCDISCCRVDFTIS